MKHFSFVKKKCMLFCKCLSNDFKHNKYFQQEQNYCINIVYFYFFYNYSQIEIAIKYKCVQYFRKMLTVSILINKIIREKNVWNMRLELLTAPLMWWIPVRCRWFPIRSLQFLLELLVNESTFFTRTCSVRFGVKKDETYYYICKPVQIIVLHRITIFNV